MFSFSSAWRKAKRRLLEWKMERDLDTFMVRGKNTTIHTILNRLGQNINQHFPQINSGGCCVFAACIAEELEVRGIEARIIVASSWGTEENNIPKARANLSRTDTKVEWQSQGINFHHVGVEYVINGDAFHYDSNGVHAADSLLGTWKIYEGRLTTDEAGRLANEVDGWNPCFDREDIPTIRRYIRKFLHANLPSNKPIPCGRASNDPKFAEELLLAA